MCFNTCRRRDGVFVTSLLVINIETSNSECNNYQYVAVNLFFVVVVIIAASVIDADDDEEGEDDDGDDDENDDDDEEEEGNNDDELRSIERLVTSICHMPASIDFDLLNSKGYKKSHEVYIPMKSTHERVLKVLPFFYQKC